MAKLAHARAGPHLSAKSDPWNSMRSSASPALVARKNSRLYEYWSHRCLLTRRGGVAERLARAAGYHSAPRKQQTCSAPAARCR